MHRDAVVGPQRPGVDAERLVQPRFEGHRKRCVNAAAKRGVQTHPPVADLVAEPFDDERAVVRHGAASSGFIPRSSRIILPRAAPSSTGRLGASAFQNAIFPGSPGAGVTTTCEGVMSTIRQVEAPRTKVSPTRVS